MGTRHNWNIVFYTTAAFYLFGAIAFEMLGTAQRQPWARIGDSRPQDLELNEITNNRVNKESTQRKDNIKQKDSSFIKNKLSRYRIKFSKPIDTQTPQWIVFKRTTYVY